MKTLKYILIALVGFATPSCYNMDIMPKNTITEEVLFASDNGVRRYMAVAYHDLPVEDFNYYVNNGYQRVGKGGNRWEGQKNSPASVSGEASGRVLKYEDYDYWTDGNDQANGVWYRIRHLNNFIAAFPAYKDNYSDVDFNATMAEARFLRAFYYFGLVRRYGGVPLMSEALDPKADLETIQMARSTEYDSWKFIHDDLKFAMDNGAEKDNPNFPGGRANRYAAAALMSRAMLYAGTIAKYTPYLANLQGPAVDQGLQGMQGKAAEFFEYAIAACEFIKDNGKYSLHTNSDKALGFAEVFTTLNNEDIFVKHYVDGAFPGSMDGAQLYHSWDECILPIGSGMAISIGATLNPSWSLVSLYEMPAITDAEGKPVRFNTREELWQSPRMEARAMGTFYFSGMTEHGTGTVLDIQAGVYRSFPGTAADAYSEASQSQTPYNDLYRIRSGSDRVNVYDMVDGVSTKLNGLHGFAQGKGDEGYSLTGVLMRKYVSDKGERGLNKSAQPWKVFRYGEILLNWAEASYELGLETNDDALKDKAFTVLAELRVRAGASSRTRIAAPRDLGMTALEEGGLEYGFSVDENLQFIRDERARELAFENHRIYDLIRWRVADQMFENGMALRTMFPYYVIDEGKWIFLNDIDPQGRRVNFDRFRYYKQIPDVAIARNGKLVRNAGY